MSKKFVCRQCKEKKDEDPRTLLKEDKPGFLLKFSPLCENCLKELQTKSIEELFPIY